MGIIKKAIAAIPVYIADGISVVVNDLSIGAVELKDALTDTRAKVKTDGVDNALVVMQNSQPLPPDAATQTTLAIVAGDTTSIDGKTPALGAAAAAASAPVVEAAQHLGVGGQVLAIGAASVRSTQLAAGLWRISGSGDIWFIQGGNACTALKATATSGYLAAGAIEVALVTDATDGYIAIIQDGAETGNVSITPIG